MIDVRTQTALPSPPRWAGRRSAQADRKRQAPVTQHRNLHSLMKARLPARLFALLQQAGKMADRQQVSVYAVGGFVRDLLLTTPTFDVDLAVEGRGIHFARTFAQRHKARVTTHERFGTATVTFADGQKLDIATARTEHYAHPAALPTVKPASIRNDAGRRDFTVNALAIRLNTSRFGELVDEYGGEQDLHDKTIRVLHDRSFIEDPTRVFRAIRFEQRLGFRLSRNTALLIREAVRRNVFRRLSLSRLSNAIIQVLSEREPGKVLARLADCNLLQFIHPQLQWSPGLARRLKKVSQAIERHIRLNPDRPVQPWIVYSMALMATLPQPAVEAALSRLKFPRRQTRTVLWVRQESERLLQTLGQRQRVNRSETVRLLRNLPDETLVFLMANIPSETGKRKLSALFTASQHVTPILTGKDLKAMGVKPGPLYKQILDRLLDARLNGTIKTEAGERRLVGQLTNPS